MTVLAMMRHAETEWSREGRIQGRTDVPLSDAGRAHLAGRTVPRECRGMRVVTSPLQRCLETATLLGLAQYESDERIAEMHWGAWEGRRLEDLRSALGAQMRENEARGFDFMPPGGESPRQVLDRVRGWLADVATNGVPTLAVAHRGVIRVILAAAAQWDMLGRPPVKLDWDSVHIFRLDGTGTPSLTRMNVPLELRRAERAAE
ncbi:MAG: histidine phosphatase family protein [Proteobacteria bacterium]|nr:histidine phosphatase family protein [Pseudomonadota bacterium]